jgi:transcription initiation factor TFIIB
VTGESKASRGELDAAYDAMNRDLGLSTGPIDPSEYLARFASELDVQQAVERRAREFAEQAREQGLDNGRNPRGVAAGCLYAAAQHADEKLTQQEAADVADVTPVTLRGTYTALAGEASS